MTMKKGDALPHRIVDVETMQEKKFQKKKIGEKYNTINDNSQNIIFKCMPIVLQRIFFDSTQLKKQGPPKIFQKRFENN
jgi:hypothetical protein